MSVHILPFQYCPPLSYLDDLLGEVHDDPPLALVQHAGVGPPGKVLDEVGRQALRVVGQQEAAHEFIYLKRKEIKRMGNHTFCSSSSHPISRLEDDPLDAVLRVGVTGPVAPRPVVGLLALAPDEALLLLGARPDRLHALSSQKERKKQSATEEWILLYRERRKKCNLLRRRASFRVKIVKSENNSIHKVLYFPL